MHDLSVAREFRTCHWCAAIEDLCLNLLAGIEASHDLKRWIANKAKDLTRTHEEETARRTNNMAHGRLPRDDGDMRVCPDHPTKLDPFNCAICGLIWQTER